MEKSELEADDRGIKPSLRNIENALGAMLTNSRNTDSATLSSLRTMQLSLREIETYSESAASESLYYIIGLLVMITIAVVYIAFNI